MMPDRPEESKCKSGCRALRWLVVSGIALYLVLFLVNSLTRTRHFTPDSMNYTDVARNLAAGKGMVQSTLGHNQTFLFDENSTLPAAFTAQAPLYPMVIAILGRLGLPFPDGALLLPIVAYACVLVLAYLLARDLYGQEAAVLSLACLLGYYPLARASGRALTDPLGTAFVLGFLLLLTRSCRSDEAAARGARIGWFLAGLAGGLAFAVRYSLWPAIVLGMVFLIIERRGIASKPAILLYLFGAALPVGLVLGHNLWAAGYLMPPMLSSDRSLASNLRDTAFSLFGSYSRVGSGTAQAAFVTAVVVVCLVVLGVRRRAQEILSLLVRGRRYLVTLWILVYSVFIVGLRSISHFDIVTSRMMLPAGVVMVVVGAALAVKAIEAASPVKHVLRVVLIAAVLLVFAREAGTLITTPTLTADQAIAESDRLTWIASNTTDRDLVIGDRAVDVPFYFVGHQAASFNWYPYCIHLTYRALMGFSRRNCSSYRSVYLVLRREEALDYDEQLYRYGQMISDLRLGTAVDAYPGIVPVACLKDAVVYQVKCNPPT